ncbi:hypothetical protein GI364_23820 [Alicyclobacillus sp. SO9]|nr:hypothetical protein GI364_23820 [Alicyclobacillus sp. SO9]
MNFSIGTVLDWNHHPYKIVKTTDPTDHGKKVGQFSYHGKVVSGVIAVFEVQGKSPSKTVVLETSTGQYYQANIEANSSQ